MPEPRYVPLNELTSSGLEAEEIIAALATAIEELGIALGLVMIHGNQAGLARYYQTRGICRFDQYGNIQVPVTAGRERE